MKLRLSSIFRCIVAPLLCSLFAIIRCEARDSFAAQADSGRTTLPVITLTFVLSDYNGFNVSCNGASNGTVDLTPDLGVAPYTFLWSNGAVTEDLSNVPAGTYNVTVTDNLGATQTGQVTLNEPFSLSISLDSIDNASCLGAATGAVYLTYGGGVPNYSYQWSDGSSADDLINVVAGTYTVTVTDNNNCTAQSTYSVAQSPLLNLQAISVDALCSGTSTGSINLTVSGGTPGFTYLWSTGATTEDLSALPAGFYTVTVTDAALCSVVTSALISEPSPIDLSFSIQNVICNGASTGGVNLGVIGGTPGYSYLWSNGFAGEDPSALNAGTYTVTVTDANNCTAQTIATISQPSALVPVATPTDVLCNGGSNGSINLSVTGGIPGYTFLWSNGSTFQNPSGLTAGTYTVTVTDANLCTASFSSVVSQPSAIALSLTAQPGSCNANNGSISSSVSGGTPGYTYLWNTGASASLLAGLAAGNYTLTVTDQNGCTRSQSVLVTNTGNPIVALVLRTNVSCNGGSNGSLDIGLSGGSPPYSYLWSNGALTQDISNLSVGSYTVTVTDQNFCTGTANFNITQPTLITSSASSTPVSCNGGSNGAINLTAGGGTPGYSYLWSNGFAGEDPSGLTAGSYLVTITDANGCTRNRTVNVSQPSAIIANSTSTQTGCGTSTGTATVSASGGVPGYSFLWNTGGTSTTITGLSIGIYAVTVTDLNGCTRQTSTSVSATNGPNITNVVITNSSCVGASNGGVNISLGGSGIPPFTYLWSNGANTQDITGVPTGTYTVTVTDNNSCTVSSSYFVGQATPISATSVITNVNCNSASTGSIVLTVAGGSTPYSYQWSNGSTTKNLNNIPAGTYTVTITDNNACFISQSFTVTQNAQITLSAALTNPLCNGSGNGSINLSVSGGTPGYTYQWSNGFTGQDPTGLASGSYSVTVTDVNSCTRNASYSLTNPSIISITTTTAPDTCGRVKGSVSASASGATPPYTYLWNTGATQATISNLSAGAYTLTVTDFNGCTRVRTVTVGNLNGPSISNAVIDSVSCFGDNDGRVNITVAGGASPYSYSWSSGQTSQDLINVTANTYNVTVTDQNGCTTSGTYTVQQPAQIQVSIGATPSTCGSANGSLQAVAVGGVPGYLYLWSNGASSAANLNIAGGNYTLTVTDFNGCDVVFVQTLGNVAGVEIDSSTITNVQCNGGNNGAISVFVSGGVPPVTFQWSNGVSTQNLSNITSGNYTVTVTDGSGCTAVKTHAVTQPPFLAATTSSTPSFCGQAVGSATVTPSGGVPPYSVLWSTGQTTSTINGLSAGTYSVTVTDSRACTRIGNAVVILSNGPVISLQNQTDVTCAGGNNGAIDITVSGGTSPYSYSWSTGAVSQDISNLTAGVYTVFVTDNTSCSDSAQFVIEEPLPLSVNAILNGAGCGQTNGSVSLVVSGGTPSYSYLWSGGQQTALVSNLAPGPYSVVITDALGCDTSLNYTVSSLPGPVVVIDSVRNIACNGGSNGRIFISVSGGSLPYSYLWSDGGTSQDRFGLSSGTYTVTVTATGGCTATVSATLTQNTAIVPAFTVTQATCNLSNGSISATVSGGVSPYSLVWENGATSSTISGLSAGYYSITVTDNLGCIKRDSALLTNAGIPQVNLVNSLQPSCFGSANGAITINISNGVSPYSFQWSNGDNSVTADSIPAGSYTVTVSDNSGCTRVRTFILQQPDSITLSVQSTASNCGLTNGSASAFASGGAGQFAYTWSSGSSSSSASGLLPGIYTVTASDQNGCVKSKTVSVGFVAAPQLNLDSLRNASCFGESDGNIFISVIGSTGPYAFQWSSGQLTEDVLNLSAAVYTVVVSDTAGCTDTLFATITQPSELLVSLAVSNASCGLANGSISASVAGGVPAYTYEWSNGSVNPSIGGLIASVYTLTVIDFNGCSNTQNTTVNNIDGALLELDSIGEVTCPGGSDGFIAVLVAQGAGPFTYQWSSGSTSASAASLPAGVYTLTVTDANNCPSLFTDTITEPDPFVITAAVTSASCNVANGVISISSVGGSSPYTYLWSTGAASSVVSGLPAGSYVVTLSDNIGCTYDSSFTIINTGTPEISIVAIDSVSCFGLTDGSINITVLGGASPYSYAWVNTSQTTQDIFNLAAGSYSVIVTDASGCTATQLISIGQPPDISVSFPQVINAACAQNNGSISVIATGGLPGYSFQWSTGATAAVISGISAGSYTVTVTDSQGCTKSAIGNVSNLTGPQIVSVDSSNVSCSGGVDGSILITATGVSLPLTYTWAGQPDTSSSLSNLAAGSYTVTVSDAAGCIAVRTINITQPAPFVINAVLPQNNPPYNLTCNGTSDGTIFLSVTGGTAPYLFVWSNGAISQNIQNLPAGTYTVFITDSRNCTASNSFTVSEPPPVTAAAGNNLIVCADSVATLAAATPTYGTGYWQVISSNGVITFADSTSPVSFISGLALGDNILLWTVTDGSCDDQDQLVITVTTEVDAIVGADRSVCGSTVNLNATRPEFGSGLWSGLNTSAIIEDSTRANTLASNLAFGVNLFQWRVINGGCRDSAVLTIIRRDSIDCLSKIELPTAFSPNDDGFNDFLLIKGLEEYPDNEIMIFNRWGQVVFRRNSYRNDWRGTGEDGNPLIDGTYFIVLKVGFLNRVFNTYLDLRR